MLNIGKMLIKKCKGVSLQPKKKYIENSFFITKICPNKHQILGNYSFFPINKINSYPSV